VNRRKLLALIGMAPASYAGSKPDRPRCSTLPSPDSVLITESQPGAQWISIGGDVVVHPTLAIAEPGSSLANMLVLQQSAAARKGANETH